MRKIITFSLLWITVYSFGQYSDSFSDSDFTSNPVWSGTTDKFVVNGSKQLQLSAPAVTSKAYLSTPSKAIDSASWQFYMNAGLLLTSGNYVDFYLVSNSPDLSGSLNGYYVMVGNTNKEVALYRQSGTTKTRLVAGISKRLPMSGSATELTVKVTRDASGTWSVYSRLPSESDFELEGIVTDTTFNRSTYSGILCNYSSSNSSNYIFDDFIVTGNAVVDSVPPAISSYGLSGDRKFIVTFSEPIDLSGASITIPADLGSYTRNVSGNILELSFATPVPGYKTFAVTLDGITDREGNRMTKRDLSFVFYPTAFRDLVFNEIMCDPNPSVGLPEVEYVELYNQRDFPVDLSGWTFHYGSRSYAILEGKVAPKGYLLLSSPGASAVLSRFGATAKMNNFPALSSTGQLLYLTNEKDSLIAFVNYNSNRYQDKSKASGGWSSECIDSDNLSDSDQNWMASSDTSGGTPGRKNSSTATIKDDVVAQISAASLITPDTLLLRFNKPMLLTDLKDVSHYRAEDLSAIKLANVDFPQGRWVKLVASGLKPGVVYNMVVSELRDVNGDWLNETAPFGIPDSCIRNDIIINEILAHPKEGGATFVELYNRSQKIIELSNLFLNRRKPSGDLDDVCPISAMGEQLFPEEYLVLTPSQKGVCGFYTCRGNGKWIEMSNFVPLSDETDNVLLMNQAGAVIDSVGYDEKRHESAIQNPAGVSFERVNPDRPSDDPDNWHSSASDAGYATPGYRNSQFREISDEKASATCFWTDTQSFTPDNDGVDDVLPIRYKMPENGYSVTVTVFDGVGRRVRQIANNAVLGAEGVLTWDGRSDSGRMAEVGVYVIYIDAAQPLKGKRHRAKIACAVALK
jgi:hypothetical protein